MTDKIRGSNQLKLDCSSFSTLTQEELIQVAGGAYAIVDEWCGTPYPIPPFPPSSRLGSILDVTIPQFNQRF